MNNIYYTFTISFIKPPWNRTCLTAFPPMVLNIAFKPENYSLICPGRKINVYSSMLSQCGPYCFLAKQSEPVSLMKQHNMQTQQAHGTDGRPCQPNAACPEGHPQLPKAGCAHSITRWPGSPSAMGDPAQEANEKSGAGWSRGNN